MSWNHSHNKTSWCYPWLGVQKAFVSKANLCSEIVSPKRIHQSNPLYARLKSENIQNWSNVSCHWFIPPFIPYVLSCQHVDRYSRISRVIPMVIVIAPSCTILILVETWSKHHNIACTIMKPIWYACLIFCTSCWLLCRICTWTYGISSDPSHEIHKTWIEAQHPQSRLRTVIDNLHSSIQTPNKNHIFSKLSFQRSFHPKDSSLSKKIHELNNTSLS